MKLPKNNMKNELSKKYYFNKMLFGKPVSSLLTKWPVFLQNASGNPRFITNGMCAKNNTHMYMARTSTNRVISSSDLYCCLLPQCEALCAKWCCDQIVKVVPGGTITK